MTIATAVAAAAVAWQAAGMSVVPARTDGSKAPLGAWRQHITTPASPEQIRHWYSDPTQTGLGIVCGQVSGGLEMLELEGRAVDEGYLERLRDLITAAGLDQLWQRLIGTYVERTPSGGVHLLYRVTGRAVPGNTKLAQRRARPDELTPDERDTQATRPDKTFWRTLAETRGEGGYVVVAPSGGNVHPTGAAWQVINGMAGAVPTITAQERDELIRCARLLDETPPPPDPPNPTDAFSAPARPTPPPGHISPGDDFEARVDWADDLLLGGAGWTAVTGHHGSYRTWRRPGKNLGISATTGRAGDRDRLYVFSTSTDFDAERPYTKFAAYTLLHHRGEFSAAATELGRLGYGTTPNHAPPPASLSTLSTPPSTGPDGDKPASMLDQLRAALLDSRGLDSIPEPTPLIKGILQLDSVAWLIGPPGNGKSFVALDMAGCVGTGEAWQTNPTTQGDVLYLVAEGASGIKPRVRAWEAAMRREMSGVKFLPVAVQSANDADWNAFVELARELRPSLIVVDTQARVTVGLEENSARDMGLFVDRVERLRAACGACVLVAHHTGKGGDMRGSTALPGAATTILRVTKDDDLVSVECEKQKDQPDFDPIKLRLISSGSSAILGLTVGPVGPIDGRPAVKRALAAWWDSHGTDWVSVTVLIDSGVIAKNTFHANKKALVRAGVVEERESGRSIRYRLPRPPDQGQVPLGPTRSHGTGQSLSPTRSQTPLPVGEGLGPVGPTGDRPVLVPPGGRPCRST